MLNTTLEFVVNFPNGSPNNRLKSHCDDKLGIRSIGATLYTMLLGRPPFDMPTLEGTYAKIRTVDYSFPKNSPVSAEARDLVNSILRYVFVRRR